MHLGTGEDRYIHTGNAWSKDWDRITNTGEPKLIDIIIVRDSSDIIITIYETADSVLILSLIPTGSI